MNEFVDWSGVGKFETILQPANIDGGKTVSYKWLTALTNMIRLCMVSIFYTVNQQ